MFRVRNQMPGPYNLILEKGSITLGDGKSFDLEGDGRCSRKWIKSDPFLRRALNEGHIGLVHDSESKLPSAPTGPATAASRNGPAKPPAKPKPKIIDFGKGEDLPVDEGGEEVKPFEDLEDEGIEDEPKAKPDEKLPHVWKDSKAELVEWAIEKEIELPEDANKREVQDAIIKSDVYKSLKQAWKDEYKFGLEE